ARRSCDEARALHPSAHDRTWPGTATRGSAISTARGTRRGKSALAIARGGGVRPVRRGQPRCNAIRLGLDVGSVRRRGRSIRRQSTRMAREARGPVRAGRAGRPPLPAGPRAARGRFGTAALVVLPYLVAYRIASAITRWWRGLDAPTSIVPGLWI